MHDVIPVAQTPEMNILVNTLTSKANEVSKSVEVGNTDPTTSAFYDAKLNSNFSEREVFAALDLLNQDAWDVVACKFINSENYLELIRKFDSYPGGLDAITEDIVDLIVRFLSTKDRKYIDMINQITEGNLETSFEL